MNYLASNGSCVLFTLAMICAVACAVGMLTQAQTLAIVSIGFSCLFVLLSAVWPSKDWWYQYFAEQE